MFLKKVKPLVSAANPDASSGRPIPLSNLWNKVLPLSIVAGAHPVVTIDAFGTNRFYRLSKP
jgi:hypothetical protein